MLHKTLCASVNAASAVLAEWIEDSAADGDDSAVRYAFEIVGDVEARTFWGWLVMPVRSEALDWLDKPDCVCRELPGQRDSIVVCYPVDCGFAYRAEWNSLKLSGYPDLSIDDTPDGVAVRWSPRAELELSVADMVTSFVLRNSFELRPYEED